MMTPLLSALNRKNLPERLMDEEEEAAAAAEKEEEKKPITAFIVQGLKGALVVLKFIFADHGKPERKRDDKVKCGSEDKEEAATSCDGNVPDKDDKSIVRHSAKCAILSKKG